MILKYLTRLPNELVQNIVTFDDTYQKHFQIVLKELALTIFMRYWNTARKDYFQLNDNNHLDSEPPILMIRKNNSTSVQSHQAYITLFPVEYTHQKVWYKLCHPILRYPEISVRRIFIRRCWDWKYLEISHEQLLQDYQVHLEYDPLEEEELYDELVRFKLYMFDAWFKYTSFIPSRKLLLIRYIYDELDHLNCYSTVQKLWDECRDENLFKIFEQWMDICFGYRIQDEIYDRLNTFRKYCIQHQI